MNWRADELDDDAIGDEIDLCHFHATNPLISKARRRAWARRAQWLLELLERRAAAERPDNNNGG